MSAIEQLGPEHRTAHSHHYFRSPVDVLRLVALSVVALALIALTAFADDAVLAFEEDVVEVFNFLHPAAERVIAGLLHWGHLVIVAVLILVPLITKRVRLVAYVLCAAALGAAAAGGLHAVLDRDDSPVVAGELAERAGAQSWLDTSAVGLAALVAILAVVGPFTSTRWRRAGQVAIAVSVLGRLLVASHLPVDLAIALPVGAACGAATLLALGRPDRRPSVDEIAAALSDAGLHTAEVHNAKVDARGSAPFFGTLTDGQPVFVKVLSEGQRAADLLFRVYRFLRLKNVGDDRPFSSLRRTVEHEALVALMARDLGVRTPRLRAVARVGSDSILLAYDAIPGSSLDQLPNEAITDEIMIEVWKQVKILSDHRIAHRDLRRANVLLGDDGTPSLIDFGFSELAVDKGILDADVAQLLAAFAVVATPERTVRTAIAGIGRTAVAESLPRLQMNALSGATQTALKAQKGLLSSLQQEVMRQCDTGAPAFEDLQRVNGKTLLMFGVLAGAVYFLIPQFSDLPEIIDKVEAAEWSWAAFTLLASVLTYIGAATSLAGAVPERLPSAPLLAAQVGSSFASKLAPAGLGGMALNVRFLQKHGVNEAVAVSGVGLNSAVGFVGHVSLVAVFFVWAGRDAFKSFRLPDPKWFLVGIGAAVAITGLGMLIPALRRLMVHTLWPIVRTSLNAVRRVLRSPSKVLLLVGGSILVTFSYLLALFLATQAFGGGLAFATVGAVYLVGSVVASAAPTPGGLGAMEAALIAGLVGAGLDNTVAVPAVFLYRLATFWVPILPGWICFQWLQRNDHL